MSASAADVEAAARLLQVGSDAELVEALSGLMSRLDDAIAALEVVQVAVDGGRSGFALALAGDYAVDARRQASVAWVALQGVRRAAQDHVRGGR
jgi:hypothetical protein